VTQKLPHKFCYLRVGDIQDDEAITVVTKAPMVKAQKLQRLAIGE